jgi:hypothetical protein
MLGLLSLYDNRLPQGGQKKAFPGSKSPSDYLPQGSGIKRQDSTTTGLGTMIRWRDAL